jgi:hypothetical protein
MLPLSHTKRITPYLLHHSNNDLNWRTSFVMRLSLITLWESEEAMRATEEEANQLRAQIAEVAKATIVNVETYEVGVSPGQR